MELKSKFFDTLTTKELYEILKARAEIFVVEQNCVYQDMDDKDYSSLHVFYEDNGRIVAYLRAFFKDEDTVQIGRVLTLKHSVMPQDTMHVKALRFAPMSFWRTEFHTLR